MDGGQWCARVDVGGRGAHPFGRQVALEFQEAGEAVGRTGDGVGEGVGGTEALDGRESGGDVEEETPDCGHGCGIGIREGGLQSGARGQAEGGVVPEGDGCAPNSRGREWGSWWGVDGREGADRVVEEAERWR